MGFKLSEEFKAKAEKICAKYPRRDAALIPLLLELQKEASYIAEEGIDALALLLELPYSRVKAVVTFYTMFNREPAGRYHLQVCRNISCHMAGSKGLLEAVHCPSGLLVRLGPGLLRRSNCLLGFSLCLRLAIGFKELVS